MSSLEVAKAWAKFKPRLPLNYYLASIQAKNKFRKKFRVKVKPGSHAFNQAAEIIAQKLHEGKNVTIQVKGEIVNLKDMRLGETIVVGHTYGSPQTHVINPKAIGPLPKNDGGSKDFDAKDFEKKAKSFLKDTYLNHKTSGTRYNDYVSGSFYLKDFYIKDIHNFSKFVKDYFTKLNWYSVSVGGFGKSNHTDPKYKDTPVLTFTGFRTQNIKA